MAIKTLPVTFHESTLINLKVDKDRIDFKFALFNWQIKNLVPDLDIDEKNAVILNITFSGTALGNLYLPHADFRIAGAEVLDFKFSNGSGYLYLEESETLLLEFKYEDYDYKIIGEVPCSQIDLFVESHNAFEFDFFKF